MNTNKKSTINDKADKIKNMINSTAEESKKNIRQLIDTNMHFIGDALDTNKKMVDSIKEQFNGKDMNDTVTDTVKQTFAKSVELAEDTLDSIINSYTRQMEMNVNFNSKLVDAIKEKNNEKILELIRENFEASSDLTVKNTKELMDFYNKHTNLALNFNKKFAEGINAQVDSLFTIQSRGMNRFTEWANEWWKQTDHKEKA